MLEIFNLSVRLGLKSLVFQYNGPRVISPVYWLVAVGSKVALMGLFAAMANGRVAWLDGEKQWGRADLIFPAGGGMSALYKRMQTGMYAAVMYHKSVKIEDREEIQDVTLLVKDPSQRERLLYKVVNDRVSYPLYTGWSTWMWEYMAAEKMMTPLSSYGGLDGYRVEVGRFSMLREEIVRRVKGGKLTA